MPLVSKPSAFACRAERLAGATSCPNWLIIRPSRLSQGVGPDADTGEEVALCETSQVVWTDIFNAPFVYFAGRDVSGFYQVTQPRCGVGVYLVVVGGGHVQPASASCLLFMVFSVSQRLKGLRDGRDRLGSTLQGPVLPAVRACHLRSGLAHPNPCTRRCAF